MLIDDASVSCVSAGELRSVSIASSDVRGGPCDSSPCSITRVSFKVGTIEVEGPGETVLEAVLDEDCEDCRRMMTGRFLLAGVLA